MPYDDTEYVLMFDESHLGERYPLECQGCEEVAPVHLFDVAIGFGLDRHVEPTRFCVFCANSSVGSVYPYQQQKYGTTYDVTRHINAMLNIMMTELREMINNNAS